MWQWIFCCNANQHHDAACVKAKHHCVITCTDGMHYSFGSMMNNNDVVKSSQFVETVKTVEQIYPRLSKIICEWKKQATMAKWQIHGINCAKVTVCRIYHTWNCVALPIAIASHIWHESCARARYIQSPANVNAIWNNVFSKQFFERIDYYSTQKTEKKNLIQILYRRNQEVISIELAHIIIILGTNYIPCLVSKCSYGCNVVTLCSGFCFTFCEHCAVVAVYFCFILVRLFVCNSCCPVPDVK